MLLLVVGQDYLYLLLTNSADKAHHCSLCNSALLRKLLPEKGWANEIPPPPPKKKNMSRVSEQHMASTNLTMTELIVSSSTKNLSSTVNFTIHSFWPQSMNVRWKFTERKNHKWRNNQFYGLWLEMPLCLVPHRGEDATLLTIFLQKSTSEELGGKTRTKST